MRDVWQVREEVRQDADLAYNYGADPLSKGHKGALIHHMNKAMLTDLRRHLVLAFLFTFNETDTRIEPLSTSKLSESQWHAINKWVDSYNEPSTNEWLPAADFWHEAKAVADLAEIYYYRLNMVELDPLFDDYPEHVREALRLGGIAKEVTQEPEPIDLPKTRFGSWRERRK